MSAVISAILSETKKMQLLIHTILSENISSLPPKNFQLKHFVSLSPIHSRRPDSKLGLGRKQKIGIGKALHSSASCSIGAMHNSLSIHYTQSITGNLQVMGKIKIRSFIRIKAEKAKPNNSLIKIQGVN